MKKLLIISGSPRNEQTSKTYVLAKTIKTIASGQGMDVKIWNLAVNPLPKAEPEYHSDPLLDTNPEAVKLLAESINASDVIVLCTPTYQGSYSGLIKNALDCMSEDQFANKTVVLACHGWSATAIMPCMHLQDIVRTMQGIVCGRFIVTDTGSLAVDQVNEKDRKRIAEIFGSLNG